MITFFSLQWASYQIPKIADCACAGNAGNVFSPPLRINDSDMHHGTCVTHVPWCMPGSVTSNFLWSRWRGKRSWHSRCMRNPQFYVSGKRPMRYVVKSFVHAFVLPCRFLPPRSFSAPITYEARGYFARHNQTFWKMMSHRQRRDRNYYEEYLKWIFLYNFMVNTVPADGQPTFRLGFYTQCIFCNMQGPLVLIWINFNLTMDK